MLLGAIVKNLCKGFSQCDGSWNIHLGSLVFIFIYLFFFFLLETAVADVLFIQQEIRL